MEPLYVPALRAAGETDTEGVDGAVPDAADMFNQESLAVAVQESVLVPVPLLLIWIGCAVGTVPPAV
jgi:hypothetical protein